MEREENVSAGVRHTNRLADGLFLLRACGQAQLDANQLEAALPTDRRVA